MILPHLSQRKHHQRRRQKKRTVSIWSMMVLFVDLVRGFDVDDFLNEDPLDGLIEWNQGKWDANIDIWAELKEVTVWEDSLIKQMLEQLWFEFGNGQVAIQFINNIINFALVVVGLIAMAVLIYGFYKMFFTEGEEWRTDAKKLIRNTLIALLVIWFARYITSRAFNLFYATTEWLWSTGG